MRAELSRAQDEMWEKATRAAPAAGLLAVGAGLGLAAAASGYRFVLRVLERATSPGFGALLATAGFGAGAFAAISAGLVQLRTVELPVPTGTLTRTARAAGEAIAEQADRAG